jgi:tRNA (mo5U34)-methyltransferase
MESVNNERMIEYINSFSWVHSIELPNGIITPGEWGAPNKTILELFNALDFKGKSVLDMGCWDGLWSFEAEKRGASMVFAIDDLSQRSYNRQHTFEVAHQILKSKVIYRPNISVYEIDKLEKQNFDIVLFFGVYYHLKHPLYALSKLRKMLKEGGSLLVEGLAFTSSKNSYAKFYYKRWYRNDPSTWWVPSLKCLLEMIESTFFKIKEIKDVKLECSLRNLFFGVAKSVAHIVFMQREKRYVIHALAENRVDPNYDFPDYDLREFDKKEYNEIPLSSESTPRY